MNDRVKGKVCGYSIDTDDIYCPICSKKMYTHRIECPSSENDGIITKKLWGENIITGYVDRKTFPIVMKCPSCSSTFRMELKTINIETKEACELKRVDLMAAARFGANNKNEE